MLKQKLYISLLIINLLSYTNLTGQTYIDSLRNIISRNPSDSEKAVIYLKIGKYYTDINLDSSLFYYNKAEKIAKEKNLRSLLIRILNNQAISIDERGYILQAKQKIDTALSIARDSAEIELLENHLGIIYMDMGLYERAYKIFAKKLKIHKQHNDSSTISAIYSYLSGIFINTQNYDSVFIYSIQAYKIDSALKDTFDMIIDLLYKGNASIHLKKYSLAKKDLFKALNLAKIDNQIYLFGDIYKTLADLYRAINKTDSAYFYYKLSQKWNKRDNYIPGLFSNYIALAKLFLPNKPLLSLKFIDSARQYINKLPLFYLKDYYQVKYQIFEKLGKYDSAFYYIQKYYITEDSIKLNQQKYEIQVAQLDAKIKNAQYKIKETIQSLKKEKKKQTLYFHFAIIVLLFSLFITYLAIKLNKNKKELLILNKKLTEARKKDEIQIALYNIQKQTISMPIDSKLDEILETHLNELLRIPWLKLQKRAIIFLTDDGQNLHIAATVNIEESAKKKCSNIQAGECLCGKALKYKQTIIEKESTENHTQRYENISPHGHYIAPIYINKKIVGVLCLFLSPKYELSKNELLFLEQYLILISNIIDRKLKTERIKTALNKQDELNQQLFAQSLLLEQQKIKLERITKQLEEQSKILDKALSDIKASITYTSYIVNTLLPSEEELKTIFKEFFLIFKPIEKIGGDFYFAKKIDNKIYFAVGDATGHGIPGAFLASQAIFFINEIIEKNTNHTSAKILTQLRIKIKEIFKHAQNTSIKYNGLDLAFCIIDITNNQLNYAGAYNSLLYVRDGQVIRIKPTKNPIGLYIYEKEFKDHFIKIKKDDMIYLQTDGFTDQLHHTDLKKYSIKRYMNLLEKIYKLPVIEQKQILLEEFEKWKGNNPQIDDITILGIRW